MNFATTQCSNGTTQSRPFPARAVKRVVSARHYTGEKRGMNVDMPDRDSGPGKNVTGRRDGHQFPSGTQTASEKASPSNRGRNVTAGDVTSPGEKRALFSNHHPDKGLGAAGAHQQGCGRDTAIRQFSNDSRGPGSDSREASAVTLSVAGPSERGQRLTHRIMGMPAHGMPPAKSAAVTPSAVPVLAEPDPLIQRALVRLDGSTGEARGSNPSMPNRIALGSDSRGGSPPLPPTDQPVVTGSALVPCSQGSCVTVIDSPADSPVITPTSVGGLLL